MAKTCSELRMNGGWLAGLKLVIVAIPVLMGAWIVFGAWTVTQITDLRLKMAKVEATRFKEADGLEIWQAVRDIKRDVAALEREWDWKTGREGS